jgi:hypothetical protein
VSWTTTCCFWICKSAEDAAALSGKTSTWCFDEDACFTGIREGWRTIHKRVPITQNFASTSINLMCLALKSLSGSWFGSVARIVLKLQKVSSGLFRNFNNNGTEAGLTANYEVFYSSQSTSIARGSHLEIRSLCGFCCARLRTLSRQ